MCAGGLTAVNFGVNFIAAGAADCVVTGGLTHGHLPMGFMKGPASALIEVMADESAFSMEMMAENIHDRYPGITKEMADLYSVACR